MTNLSKANITRAVLRHRTAKTNPKFRSGEFSGFESSPEILEACEDVAGFEFDLENKDECQAFRVWADPTPPEWAAIVKAAWEYADDDTDVLHWCVERLRRPGHPRGPSTLPASRR